MIDLHTHTTASDGTYSPAELIAAAAALALDALAITDHDTFDGSDEARPLADAAGIRLVSAIEVSTKLRTGHGRARSVHLLGYFPAGPGESFRAWIAEQQRIRHERNERLAARFRELGVAIELEEVRRIGRNMTGRPHFARVLIAKGYASSIQDAFDRYLDESAPGWVEKHDPTVEEAIDAVRAGGGIPSMAHPVRVRLTESDEETVLARLADVGLSAVEVQHSDHGPAENVRYAAMAERFGLAPSAGSDFHGANKPDVRLGTGRGNVNAPLEWLERLTAAGR